MASLEPTMASSAEKRVVASHHDSDSDTASQTAVSNSSGTECHKTDPLPMSASKAVALVITLTGAAFINVRTNFLPLPTPSLAVFIYPIETVLIASAHLTSSIRNTV